MALTSTPKTHSHVKPIDQTRAFPFLLLLCKCETLSPFGKRNKITSKSPSLIKPVRRTLASLDDQREKRNQLPEPLKRPSTKKTSLIRSSKPHHRAQESKESPHTKSRSSSWCLLIVGLLCFNSFLRAVQMWVRRSGRDFFFI